MGHTPFPLFLPPSHLLPAVKVGSHWGGLLLWFPHLNSPHVLSSPMVAPENTVASSIGAEHLKWAISPGNQLADLKALVCSHVNTVSIESRRKDNQSKLLGNPHKQLHSWRGSSFSPASSLDVAHLTSCRKLSAPRMTGGIKNKNWLSENKSRPENLSHPNLPQLADYRCVCQKWVAETESGRSSGRRFENVCLLFWWGFQQQPHPTSSTASLSAPLLVWDGAHKLKRLY